MGDRTSRIVRDHSALENSLGEGEVKGREPEIKSLVDCLGLASRKIRPLQVWVSGPPGSGKTSVAKAVLRKLCDMENVRGSYVNCWLSKTLHAVVEAVVQDLRLLDVERIDTQFKLTRLKEELAGSTLIVVLDELDRVSRKEREEIIYALSRVGMTGLLCISSTLEAFVELDERVRSRLSPFQLRMRPYDAESILELLRDRAERGLREGTWDEDLLTRIGVLSRGDARLAVRTLKQASQLAEVSNSARLEVSHAEHGWAQVLPLERKYVLDRLTDHHGIIYKIVKTDAPIQMGVARERYLAICKKEGIRPVARRTFSHYVDRLIQEGLLAKERSPTWGNVRILKLSDRLHPPSLDKDES